MRRSGYEVTCREFDGPHTVPEEVVREALTWMGADEAAGPVRGEAAD